MREETRRWDIYMCAQGNMDIKDLGPLTEAEQRLYEKTKEQYERLCRNYKGEGKPMLVPVNDPDCHV